MLAVDFLSSNHLTVNDRKMRLRQDLEDGVSVDVYFSDSLHDCAVVVREIPCVAIEAVTIPTGKSARVKFDFAGKLFDTGFEWALNNITSYCLRRIKILGECMHIQELWIVTASMSWSPMIELRWSP